MTKKSLEILKVMSLLEEKKLTQVEAGKRLRLTDRQIGNSLKRYRNLGDQEVISKKIGKPGNRQLPKNQQIEFTETMLHYRRLPRF